MTYNITNLRADLAGTIKSLREGDEKMTVDKAKAISDLAGRMIDSAKIEVEAARVIGPSRMRPTGFIALEHQDNPVASGNGPKPATPKLKAPEQTTSRQQSYTPIGSGPRGSIR